MNEVIARMSVVAVLLSTFGCSSAEDRRAPDTVEQATTYCQSAGDLHLSTWCGDPTGFVPAIPHTGAVCDWNTQFCQVDVVYLDMSNGFEAQLSNACGGVTKAYRRYQGSNDDSWKTLVCYNTSALQSFLAAHGMTARTSDSCDACVGDATAGYVFVDWDPSVITCPVCPSGCGSSCGTSCM